MRSILRFGFLLAFLASAAATAQPGPRPDGVPLAAPAEQGVDGARLEALRERLRQPDAAPVRSVLLVRNGRLLFEHYASGFDAATPQQTNSITKSVLSAVIGIAIGRKLIAGLDQKIVDWLPEASAPNVDPRVRDITIGHLLAMSSGFDWNEQASDQCRRAPGADCARYRPGADLVAFALARPMADAPGTRFRYDSYGSHLLSVIVTRATGMNAARFAQQELGTALGITNIRWPSDAQGHSYGGWSLQATPRDLAKFGQLYLNKGSWNGKQLVPADYIEASTRQQIQGGWPMGDWSGYGYHWWVLARRNGTMAYLANGAGGQWLYNLPALGVVVVVTADPQNQAGLGFVLSEYLLPAIEATR